MKYEKPTVEIINIENEDIIVASYLGPCAGGTRNGSNNCGNSNGIVGEPNSSVAMGCSGSGTVSYEGLCVAYVNGLTCNTTGTTTCTDYRNATGVTCMARLAATVTTCTNLIGYN